MCRGNTAESVEGVPLPLLRKGRNKRIDWCHRAHLAMYRHLAKHKPNRRSCGQEHLEDLLTDLNCVHPSSAYSAVVYPRVQRALEAKFVKLVKDQIIVEDEVDGTCVWPAWTSSWTRSDWDGETQPPLLPLVEEQTSLVVHPPASTESLNPTYLPPPPPETLITPTGQRFGRLQSSGVLTTGFDPFYTPTDLSTPGAPSSGWSTTSFNPSYAPSDTSSKSQPRSGMSSTSTTTFNPWYAPSHATKSILSTPDAPSSGWSTTSFNPSYAPSDTPSKPPPRSGSSGLSTSTFNPWYAPSHAAESISSRPRDDESSRVSTTSFNPINMPLTPPATPQHRRGDEGDFTPGPQDDDDPIFPSDSSSNLGARRGRRRGAAQRSLPTVREQDVEHEDLVKGTYVSLARQERRPRTPHNLDKTRQPTPSSLTPLSTPLRMGQHVNAWLNQQQDPPSELPELPHLAATPPTMKTPSPSKSVGAIPNHDTDVMASLATSFQALGKAPSKSVAAIPNHGTDVMASLATSFQALVGAINHEKLTKLNAADHSQSRTLSAIDDAIISVKSLLQCVQGGGGAHAHLDPAAAVTCKDTLVQCRSVVRRTEKRSGSKYYEDARVALRRINGLRDDLAGLASTAVVANPWHGKQVRDDEAGVLIDLVFGQ